MRESMARLDFGSEMAYKETKQHIFLKWVFINWDSQNSVHSCETLLQVENHCFLFLLTHKQPIGFFSSSIDFSTVVG